MLFTLDKGKNNSRNRTFFNAGKAALRTSLPIMLALVFLGVSYGVYMRSCGFGVMWPICMAAIIFAGSMEFITVGLLLSTFNPLYALLLTLIVNGRHIFYGISMLEKYRNTGWKKFCLVSGMIDEAFTLNYATKTPPGTDRNWFMCLVTLFLYLSWVIGTIAGAISGATAITGIKGIGFVMTALFIVIFICQWQKEKTHGSSLLGLATAVICLPLFGKTYFMLPTIMIVIGIFSIRWLIAKDKEKL
jgi:4-azaleucine resistance transporter AzlC